MEVGTVTKGYHTDDFLQSIAYNHKWGRGPQDEGLWRISCMGEPGQGFPFAMIFWPEIFKEGAGICP